MNLRDLTLFILNLFCIGIGAYDRRIKYSVYGVINEFT
uniref:Uncharacterized protein n=1 Tax=Siphoviridae sp. ctBCr48 TaxID=2827802 RepID=A0A8S5SH39_9CAUD|nr:MAG TPA: hypothetical protein [Siphoviridae sp. ctBCr48]